MRSHLQRVSRYNQGVKSINEIYREFPDDERDRRAAEQAAKSAPPVPPRKPCSALSKVAGILFLGALAFIAAGLVATGSARCNRWKAERRLLDSIEQAVRQYASDFGELPRGGAPRLAERLARYLELHPALRDGAGNFVSPTGSSVRFESSDGRSYRLWTERPQGRGTVRTGTTY